eukprot:gnl/TRDRNA2_/TRDRNA2_169297_c0_seq2.p1 gnl/TRDRNA2_/TRDRNA2_169297_c0~~gnl/TRDRNA2_/TRDRNA2_169297_c0_seq2.p1  ORF type:complete len:208 (-),score=24.64 gnl/TRDRNA2_/TRDRNA2_169297_c0_seq2:77-700(-)
MAALLSVSRSARSSSVCPSHGCATFVLIWSCWANAATIATSLTDKACKSSTGEKYADRHDESSLLQVHVSRRSDLPVLNKSAVVGHSSKNATAAAVAIQASDKSYDNVAGKEQGDPFEECKLRCLAVDRERGPAAAQIPRLARAICQMYNNWRVGVMRHVKLHKKVKCGSLSRVVERMYPQKHIQCVCQSDTNIIDDPKIRLNRYDS